MKKLILFSALMIFLSSCSLDDGTTTFAYEIVPVTEVAIPDTLVFHENYRFEVTYERPSNCHFMQGFDYEKEGNVRSIGVVNGVTENQSCETFEDSTAVAELNFLVERNDFYIFKFWQGEDENGEPVFLTKEVPVKIE